MSGAIQLFLQANALGPVYEAFKSWDVGDIVGAEGTLMRTRTGELSVKVQRLRLLTKSLRPLPDKWHGLADVEQRYRQRYVDLIVNPESREVFLKRSRIVGAIRRWLDARRFPDHFSSIPGSGPRAALRLAAASCRRLVVALGPSTALRAGCVAGGRTRPPPVGRAVGDGRALPPARRAL
jgi:hypothetical protein